VTSLQRGFALGLVGTAATIVAGLLRTKILAVALGAVGVGWLAELQQTATLVTIPAGLATGPALLAWTATQDPQQWRERAPRAIQTSLTAALLVTALAALAAPLLSLLTDTHLRVPHAALPSSLLALAAGAAVWSTVLARVLVARARLGLHTVISSTAAIGTALLAALGAWLGGLQGAAWGTLAGGGLTILLWTLGYRRVGADAPPIARVRLDRDYLKQAIGLGLAAFSGIACSQLAMYALRNSVGAHLGGRGNGLFQAGLALEALVAQATVTALGQVLLPRFAAAAAKDELALEVRRAAHFLSALLPPALLVAIGLRVVGIRILYTREFLDAAPLVALLFGAVCLKMLAWVQDGALLYRGHGRPYTLLQVASWTFFGGLGLFLVPRLGLFGLGLAHVLTYVAYLPLSAWLLHRHTGATIGFAPVAMSAVPVAFALMARWVDGPPLWVSLAVVTLLWAVAVWVAQRRRLLSL